MKHLTEILDGATGIQAIERIQRGLIGEGVPIATPSGPRALIYADYTASGRALDAVEDYITRSVLPFYANSHTEASFCGQQTTRLREAARAYIARMVNAQTEDAVIFTGAGATGAVNKLVGLLGLKSAPAAAGARPVVVVGPYEHHSNILPWRESHAEVIELRGDPSTGVDMGDLERVLRDCMGRPLVVGSFSAASNVTGIITDVERVSAKLKQYGALTVWDYAGGAPYLPIDMNPADETPLDAIFLSPHKFVGGPGASGLLIVKKTIAASLRPFEPGGGTVKFVSPWNHDYSASLIAREEAGTPDIIGNIRVALAFAIKHAVGLELIHAREEMWNTRALATWRHNPALELLGTEGAQRLPIFSFRVRDGQGGYIHHQLFTRLLSDRYGIQARGGCACAGPYAHALLGISQEMSERLRGEIAAGHDLNKPGWVRLNLHYAMDDATISFIIDAVDHLAQEARQHAKDYICDPATSRFSYGLQQAS